MSGARGRRTKMSSKKNRITPQTDIHGFLRCVILRRTRVRQKRLKVKAFVTYVRPLVDYCIPVFNPYYVKDTELIERLQRSFTNRLPVFLTPTA